MQLLSHAEAALKRNWRVVFAYIVATVLLVTVYSFVMSWLELAVPKDTNPKPFWYVLTTLSADLIKVVLITIFQSIAFTLIGSEMDRPLWKCDGWRDGLTRFFTLWFIINLLYVTSDRLPGSLPEAYQVDTVMTVLLFQLGLTVFAVPFGACIMHGGGLHWKDVPQMLAPFFRLFPMSLVAMSLGFMQFFVFAIVIITFSRESLESPWLWAVVNIPLILLECLAFAVMWLACIQYRDVAPEEDNDDFDF